MYCKKCGAALPSHGFICKRCGMMMSSEQIKQQKAYMKDDENKKYVELLSDKYSNNRINRDYSNKRKENKLLGVIIIIVILMILIVLAILKVMN